VRGVAAVFWFAAIQMAAALLVGNVLAKRLAILLTRLIAGMSW